MHWMKWIRCNLCVTTLDEAGRPLRSAHKPKPAETTDSKELYMDKENTKLSIEKHDRMARYLGIHVDEAREGYARVSAELTDDLRNGVGLAHGGLIFTLADIAFAAASNYHETATLNVQTSISYIKAGKYGPLTAEAHAVHEGRTLVTFNIEVRDSDKTLLATACITGCRTSFKR